MYQVFCILNAIKRLAFYGDTFATIDAAKDRIDSEFGVVFFETDPGHDAADVFAANMEIYAIERKGGFSHAQ